ncbi:hypothetical protein L7F22_036939 [Adiantum nelumboides]|nr:hypothetical protein [Adiantum nelumboides]
MRDMVPVIYSGDRYFDDQGFMYIVVLNPSIIDKWGMIGTKEKVDIEPEEAPPSLNKPNLKLQRVNDMTRVYTDNIFMRLYKYDGEKHMTYYRCEEPLLRELSNEKKLYVFTYGEDAKSELIMADKYGRSYVNVDPNKLAGYTYFEGPLANFYFTPPKPEPFVRHIESMGYPIFPDPRPVLSEVRPMGSYGETTHMESGTHSRYTHAREAMSHGERDADARSSGKIPVETHSRGTDKRRDTSDRTRMWADTRPMRPSQKPQPTPSSHFVVEAPSHFALAGLGSLLCNPNPSRRPFYSRCLLPLHSLACYSLYPSAVRKHIFKVGKLVKILGTLLSGYVIALI